MITIDNITDCKNMLETRQQLHAEIDELITSMWRHTRAELDGKNLWRPYFPRSPEVDSVLGKLDEADHKLATLASDTSELASLMSGYSSIEEMARAKNGAASAIQQAESAIRKAMQTAISQGIAPEDLRDAEAVRDAELRRDAIVAEKGSLSEDLADRIAKAKAILEKYL
jgi:hypothetical protein